MKIIITNISLKKELNAFAYSLDGKKMGSREVIFPINAILQNELKAKEKVKVIMLVKDGAEGNGPVNAGIFQKELNDINRSIGAEIEYLSLITPFVETKDIHEKLFRDIVCHLEKGADIYADITYGPKALPIIMFTVLNFAEKYFDCDIKCIAYGKVDFVDDGTNTGRTIPINPCLYDMTSLYYLNAITNAVSYKNSDDALKALDSLLNLKDVD